MVSRTSPTHAHNPRELLLILALLGAAACTDSPGPGADAAAADASPTDGAVADAGEPARDAGDARADATPDAAVDAEPVDSGPADSGDVEDAGAPDTGIADTGIADAGAWPRPACAQVVGTQGVTFTLDEGRTLTPTLGRPTGVSYTYGLAALGEPGLVLAVHDNQLLRSTDSGCNWAGVAPLSGGFPVSLLAAGRERAYAWSENNPELFRIDGTTITPLTSPVANIHGIAVDSKDWDHLRIAGGDGELWESTTAGAGRFTSLGTPAFPGSGLVYHVAFDPQNLDRAIAGAASDGARWTDDAGATWHPVTGLSVSGRANIFSIAYSPAAEDVVWLEGIDLDENLAGAPGEGRHIWLSTDGGHSARAVLTQTATVTLINGTLLAPHPEQPEVLYFVFGTYFQGYGTDIFRYDAGTGHLEVAHNSFDSVDAITFAPGDPAVMYLGLTSEQIH